MYPAYSDACNTSWKKTKFLFVMFKKPSNWVIHFSTDVTQYKIKLNKKGYGCIDSITTNSISIFVQQKSWSCSQHIFELSIPDAPLSTSWRHLSGATASIWILRLSPTLRQVADACTVWNSPSCVNAIRGELTFPTR